MPDPGVLEEVLLVGCDHRLLPTITGERPNRLDVFPNRDVEKLSRGRLTGLPDMLRQEPRLLRHQRYSGVAEKRFELTLLARVIVGRKTRMIMAFSLLR